MEYILCNRFISIFLNEDADSFSKMRNSKAAPPLHLLSVTKQDPQCGCFGYTGQDDVWEVFFHSKTSLKHFCTTEKAFPIIMVVSGGK